MERKCFSVQEAAKILHIGKSKAYMMAASGELPCLKLGKRIVIPAEVIDRILERPLRAMKEEV